MIVIKYLTVILFLIFSSCSGAKDADNTKTIVSIDNNADNQQEEVDTDPHGLCKECINHKQCINDEELVYSGICIENQLTGESFCSRSCYYYQCPNNFICVQVIEYFADPSRTEDQEEALKIYTLQCVPEKFDISCEENLSQEGKSLSGEDY